MAYRAILTDGDIDCEQYEEGDHGVELFSDGSFVAFVPYANLVAIFDEEALPSEDRSIA